MSVILVVHAAATWALVGLIWFVQLVQYPGFAEVAPGNFGRFHALHCRRISWMVAPLMAAEFGSAVWLFFIDGMRAPWFVASLALLAINWLSTALIQMPLHDALSRGFSHTTIRRLVAGNWLRTAAWTGRGLCVGLLLVK